MPTNLKEDLWVQAAEVRPSDRAVVHHICVYIDDHDEASTNGRNRRPSSPRTLPGDVPPVFPPGSPRRFPPDPTCVFEIHYTPIGKVRFDRPSVGLILSKEPPRHLAITRGIAGWGLKIPPGAPDHIERADWTISATSISSASRRTCTCAERASSIRPTIPTAASRCSFGAPLRLQLAERLPARRAQSIHQGHQIHCEAHYDNSSSNLANPDPDATVIWGEQTWDEMMMGYLDYYEDDAVANC